MRQTAAAPVRPELEALRQAGLGPHSQGESQRNSA